VAAPIGLERVGGTAVLRMAHGPANAIDLEFLAALADAVGAAGADPGISSVVLTGSGSIFSAGVDLFRLLDGGAAYVREFLPLLGDVLLRLLRCDLPVVAAVNGHAIAGGCVLAAACDRRLIAAGPGRIGVTELLVGVPFPVVPFEIMRGVVPASVLGDMVLSGRTLVPEEARRAGLVDEVVAPEVVETRALEEAARLGALAPSALRITKQQLHAPVLEAIARRRTIADVRVEEVWGAPETLARIRDYVDRTLRRTA
jgi:enoyl-CoA hydratase/carnithine racemase